MAEQRSHTISGQSAYPLGSPGAADYVPGLTKRELFAAMALQGLMANGSSTVLTTEWKIVASDCITAADALLEALTKTEKAP